MLHNTSLSFVTMATYWVPDLPNIKGICICYTFPELMQIFASGKRRFDDGILCDTPKISKGKKILIIVPLSLKGSLIAEYKLLFLYCAKNATSFYLELTVILGLFLCHQSV